MFKKLMVSVLLASTVLSVQAQSDTPTLKFEDSKTEQYIDVMGVTLHNQKHQRDINPGVGYERYFDKDWSTGVGVYTNSEGRVSTYGYARYRFYKDEHWDAGVALGAVTGYTAAPAGMLAFVPEVCYDYVCAKIIPPNGAGDATALAATLRIPL